VSSQPVGSQLRFCLITAGNVVNRPRLLKAADALAAAGHDVHVVALDVQPELAARDTVTIEGRAWSTHRLPLRRGTVRGTLRRAMARGGQLAALSCRGWGGRGPSIEDRAISRYLRPLTRCAIRTGADIFVAHGLQALPVAGRASARTGGRLAFDAEDLHAGEMPDEPAFRPAIALVRAVEQRYLPRCTYLTASSDGIADALVERYHIGRPLVILNTFPWAERAGAIRLSGSPGSAPRRPGTVSLYWFSQVIGSGRGLEDAVDALAMLPPAVELHLRGQSERAFVDGLWGRARALGVAERLFVWPPVLPADLIPLAMQHDIGLALEPGRTANQDLCMANKLFVYLTAGVAIAATDTRGQRTLLDRVPGAGFVFEPGDVKALAAGVRRFVEHPQALRAARAASARAAECTFAWERDAPRLVAYLTGAVDG